MGILGYKYKSKFWDTDDFRFDPSQEYGMLYCSHKMSKRQRYGYINWCQMLDVGVCAKISEISHCPREVSPKVLGILQLYFVGAP